MYAAITDPYCYQGTTTLRNKLGLRDADLLQDFEDEISKQRAGEPLPDGRLSGSHYRAIHRHLFQDVYGWAGRFRTVRIAKGESVFAYPERIPAGMRTLFDALRRKRLFANLPDAAFADEASHFLAELNALHPFRDGNGRTQLVFLAYLAERAGHPLDLTRLHPEPFLAAMVASFRGDEVALVRQIRTVLI